MLYWFSVIFIEKQGARFKQIQPEVNQTFLFPVAADDHRG